MVTQNPDFSICIPFYNTDSIYLRECLDSVAEQINADFEVIIVDDGSTESSFARLQEIVETYPSIPVKVVHIEHAGLYEARRAAYASASGRYVVNLDSDDCLFDGEALERVKRAIDQFGQPDMIMFNAYCDRAGHIPMQRFEATLGLTGQIGRESFFNVFVGTYALNSAVCKVFKADIAKSLAIVEPDLVMCEDRLITVQVLQSARSIAVVDEPLMYYRQRPDSSVHREFRFGDFEQQVRVERHVLRILQAEGIDVDRWANARIRWIVGDCLSVRKTIKSPERRHDMYRVIWKSSYANECWSQRRPAGAHADMLLLGSMLHRGWNRAFDWTAHVRIRAVDAIKHATRRF